MGQKNGHFSLFPKSKTLWDNFYTILLTMNHRLLVTTLVMGSSTEKAHH